jgi:predicted ATPase
VALFVDRATATNPSWQPSIDDREVIADICERLDGLPLAVELAAARTRGLSLNELLDALDTRPEVLRGGNATPLRHRSLRAVMDWSYALLTPAEQRVFDRLAVFRGGFSLDAAAAVASDDDLAGAVVERAVLALLDRALLVERADDPARRYTMLDVGRRYGLGHLEAQGALDHAAERHAHWFLTQTERAAGSLASAGEPAAARSMEHGDHGAHLGQIGSCGFCEEFSGS